MGIDNIWVFVAGILVTLAVPAFNGLVANSRMASSANDLATTGLIEPLRDWLDVDPASVGQGLLLLGAIHNIAIPEEDEILEAIAAFGALRAVEDREFRNTHLWVLDMEAALAGMLEPEVVEEVPAAAAEEDPESDEPAIPRPAAFEEFPVTAAEEPAAPQSTETEHVAESDPTDSH